MDYHLRERVRLLCSDVDRRIQVEDILENGIMFVRNANLCPFVFLVHTKALENVTGIYAMSRCENNRPLSWRAPVFYMC